MNDYAISNTKGDLNYILTKYLIDNLNIEESESESEFLKKIVKNNINIFSWKNI